MGLTHTSVSCPSWCSSEHLRSQSCALVCTLKIPQGGLESAPPLGSRGLLAPQPLIIFFFWPHCMWHAGSLFPDQGLNLCPVQWKQSLHRWTTGEVLHSLFCSQEPPSLSCGTPTHAAGISCVYLHGGIVVSPVHCHLCPLCLPVTCVSVVLPCVNVMPPTPVTLRTLTRVCSW